MALEKLSPPPVTQPFDLPNGQPNPAWTQWYERLFRILGKGTGIAQLDISGNAATSTSAASVPVISAAGAPEGNEVAPVGVIYIDISTNIKYVKSSGDDAIGWTQL